MLVIKENNMARDHNPEEPLALLDQLADGGPNGIWRQNLMQSISLF
jgi:hypothetical protein